ncbi:uncharacterized protein LOC135951199 [Calliphora vicina]|uniref:uncharacterized protein LOC135951199 n=1 Tax=Calliphora vicina TaxID=7373 RepID=UPI00325C0523
MLTTTKTTTASVAATRKATAMMTTRNMNSGSSSSSNSSSTSTSTSVSRGIATDTDTATTTIKTTTTTTTTITSDPGILCFHHCNVKVFCFTLPHICPQCKTALATHPNGDANSSAGGGGGGSNRRKNKNTPKLNKNNKNNNYTTTADHSRAIDSNKDDDANNHVGDTDATDDSDDDDDDDNDLNRNSFTSHIMASRLLPFRLPYPFVRANQYPCAIVLRPTTGDFLNDYNNTTDLHIAVTTSTGCVVEFDRHGLRRHRTDNMSEWWQCLLVGDVPEPWYDYWDQVLFEICQQPDKWTVSHYHEDKHNCYTFVLTFLQALTYDKLSEAATSKTRFCEKYIVPRTTTAGKYISLYRKLRDAGIYVHHTNHHKVRYAKQGKQQQQQQLLQQRNPNKSNNLTTTTTMTKNSLVTNKHQQQKQQQQHLSNHHNHHSIISRPHSTLCTIEE